MDETGTMSMEEFKTRGSAAGLELTAEELESPDITSPPPGCAVDGDPQSGQAAQSSWRLEL